jgi:hypothetical protein
VDSILERIPYRQSGTTSGSLKILPTSREIININVKKGRKSLSPDRSSQTSVLHIPCFFTFCSISQIDLSKRLKDRSERASIREGSIIIIKRLCMDRHGMLLSVLVAQQLLFHSTF